MGNIDIKKLCEPFDNLRERTFGEENLFGGYESPITMIASQVETKIENDVMTAVQHYDIQVDKEELIKALAYDRGQYEKGYADRGNKIVPVVLEMNEGHAIRQINAYLDKATQTIYANWITVECAEAIGWKIKEGDN